RVERRRQTDVESSIARQQHWRVPVALHSFLVEKEHRHFRLVLRLVPHLLRLKLLRLQRYIGPPPRLRLSGRGFISIDRGRRAKPFKIVEDFLAVPAPPSHRNASQTRQFHRSPVFPICVKHFHFRAGISRVYRDQFSCRRPQRLQVHPRLRNHFLPLIAPRLPQVHRKHPPLRRLPVRHYEKLLASHLRIKQRILIVHHRKRRSLFLHVLRVNLASL